MADAMFTLDCKEQFTILKQHRTSEALLAPMLEGLCNTLAMGIEEYLRAFDAKAGLDLLADIGTTNIKTNGDAATMCLRSLSLVLEHVPRAIEVASSVANLVPLVRAKFARMHSFAYSQYSASALCEDALRIVAFLSEGDDTAALTTSGLLTDITTAMDLLDSASIGRCLAAIAAMLSKIVLPPNTPSSVAAAPAATKADKKDKKPKGSPLLSQERASSLRRELTAIVVPKITHILTMATGRVDANGTANTGGNPGASDRDSWPVVEKAVECLDVLLYRLAIAAHPRLPDGSASQVSPWVAPLNDALTADPLAALVASPDNAASFLTALVRLANTEKRQLTILASLSHMAHLRRDNLRVALLDQEVVDFFTELLAPAKRDLGSMLVNCFPRRAASSASGASPGHGNNSSTNASSTLVTTAAAHFLHLLSPPLANTELKIHFRVIPVHTWEWSDDMHAFTEYADDACVVLECARLSLHPSVVIKVRSTQYRVDVDTLRQINIGSGVGRPVRRSPIPKAYVFVDWASRVATFVGQSVQPMDAPERGPLPPATMDELLQLIPVYGPLMMAVAASASSEVVRSLASGAVVRLFSTAASPYPPAGFYRCVEAMLEDIGTFLATVLAGADDLVTIDEVFVLMKLLFAVAAQDSSVEVVTPKHRPNPDPEAVGTFTVSSFAKACRRFGVVKKLQSLVTRLNAKFNGGDKDRRGAETNSSIAGSVAMLARAADLESLCGARPKNEMTPQTSFTGATEQPDSFALDAPAVVPSSPAGVHAPIAALVELFRTTDSDAQREAMLPELIAAFNTASSMTVHEFSSLHLTTSLARFICATVTTARSTDTATIAALESTIRRRMTLFAELMQKYPAAANFLVRMLVSEMALTSKRLPEVQGVGTRVGDKCRPWQDVLQRLASVSPYVDVCSNKDFNANARLRQQEMAARASPQDLSMRCPSGHPLRRETSRDWTCDVCSRGFDTPTSLGCRECNFDICPACHARGHQGGAAIDADRLPGVRVHLFATVGDVEAHFRKPLAERYPRPGGRLSEVLAQMDALQNMLGLAGSAERGPGGLADVMRAMMMANRHGRGDGEEVDPLRPPTDTLPPLTAEAPRRDLYYAGLGRVPYQESVFSCLYRKAMGLGIAGAITAFEDAVMIAGKEPGDSDGHYSPLGTPVRSTPPRRPGENDQAHSPTEIAANGFNPNRTYYFHVASDASRRNGLCCCGDIELPAEGTFASNPSVVDDRGEDTSAASPNRQLFGRGGDSPVNPSAVSILAAESPTEVALRLPELEGTGRFMLLRVLRAVTFDAASQDLDGVPRLKTPIVPAETFVCHDLGVKAVKAAAASAMRVALMPPQFALPGWLVEVLHFAPYLIPVPVRQQLLQFLASGARRALAEAVGSQGLFANPIGPVEVPPSEWTSASHMTNRPPPKEIVRREAFFEADALKALIMTAERRVPLMFEFAGDKGTGQGPTQQFFTMVAETLCRSGRGLWRAGDEAPSVITGDAPPPSVYINTPPEGFFPRPSTSLGPDSLAALRKAFYLAGAASGRALIDGRLFPLALSPAVFTFVKRRQGLHVRKRGRLAAYRLSDVELVDQGLGLSLRRLVAMRDRAALGDDVAVQEIEAMDLTFVLPGYDNVELVEGGANIAVTASNINDYIELTINAVLDFSVAPSLTAFATGFSDVVPPDALLALDPQNLVLAIAGSGVESGKPLWTREEIGRCLKGDHGYSRDSKELAWLRDVLTDFDSRQQRAFLHFCTGCPRLPLGGLAALGNITVVRKDSADGQASLSLPSVNTCFKYLKLPPYASPEAMKAGLLKAVMDAGDGFDLS